MAATRNSSNETQKAILQLLTKNDHVVDERGAKLNKGATMNGIKQTQYKAKKKKLENVGANNDKIQKLDKEIKSTKNMIKISRAELKHQMEEMERAMKGLDDSSMRKIVIDQDENKS